MMSATTASNHDAGSRDFIVYWIPTGNASARGDKNMPVGHVESLAGGGYQSPLPTVPEVLPLEKDVVFQFVDGEKSDDIAEIAVSHSSNQQTALKVEEPRMVQVREEEHGMITEKGDLDSEGAAEEVAEKRYIL